MLENSLVDAPHGVCALYELLVSLKTVGSNMGIALGLEKRAWV